VKLLRGSDGGSLLRVILRNTVWSTLAVLATPVLALLFGGLTLRYLGLEQAGYAITVAAVFSIFGRFATLGLGSAALPSLAAAIGADDELRGRRLIGMLLIVFGLSAAIPALVLFAVSPWFTRWTQCPLQPQVAASYILICGLTHVLTQISLVLGTTLRAANRYDLVTLATTPLAFASGVAACVLLPLFPSLLTMAAVSAVAAFIGTGITAWLAVQAVPWLVRPLPGFGELPGLARYGSWLLMGNALASLTTGVDELVITTWCGPAAVPPWAIGKRLWITIHTFLAQHVEHLVPLLGSLRSAEASRVDRIAASMHWYVVSLAAAAFVVMAWGGEAVIGLVAGAAIAPACRPAVLAFSLFGLAFALMIVPVTLGLARGLSRSAFDASVILQVALFGPLCLAAWLLGAPWLYYAPLLGLPVLPLATLTTAMRLGDAHPVRTWLRPVAVPLAAAGFVIGAAYLPAGLAAARMIVFGGLLAAAVLLGTLSLERWLGMNKECHAQLAGIVAEVIRQGRKLSGWMVGAWPRS